MAVWIYLGLGLVDIWDMLEMNSLLLSKYNSYTLISISRFHNMAVTSQTSSENKKSDEIPWDPDTLHP